MKVSIQPPICSYSSEVFSEVNLLRAGCILPFLGGFIVCPIIQREIFWIDPLDLFVHVVGKGFGEFASLVFARIGTTGGVGGRTAVGILTFFVGKELIDCCRELQVLIHK